MTVAHRGSKRILPGPPVTRRRLAKERHPLLTRAKRGVRNHVSDARGQRW